MTRDAKAKCYSDIYMRLKDNPNITDLTFPKERKNYDFSCLVGPIAVNFTLSAEKDRGMLRGVFSCDKSGADISAFLKKLTEKKEEISGFGSQRTGVLSMTVLLQDLSDEQAVEKLKEFSKNYFSFLIDNEDTIVKYIAARDDEKKEQNTEVESSKITKETDKGVYEAKENEIKSIEKKRFDHENPVVAVEALKSSSKKQESSKCIETQKKENESARMKKMDGESKKLEKEKAEFKQYCQDQRHLFDNEKNKLSEREDKIKVLEKELENEKQEQHLRRSELEQSAQELANKKQELDEKKKALDEQLLGLKKEREELKAEKDKWDNTSLDEKLIQRRKELEKLEDNQYKKEQDFQVFQNNILSDISDRLDTVAEKEKEMIKKEEAFRKRQSEQQDLEAEIDLRYKKIQEQEKHLAKKEAKLSDLEASLRRTDIIKTEAENELHKLEIQKKNFDIRVEQQDMKEEEFHRAKEDFSKKYHKVMLDIDSLEEKKKELETKETALRTLIGKNEKLEAQLKELKEDTSKTTNLLKEKDDMISKKENIITKQKKTLKSLEDKLHQEQKKYATVSEDNTALMERVTKAEVQVEKSETELAKIRTELYTTKEELRKKDASNLKEKPAGPSADDRLKMKKLQESERHLKENNEALIKNIEELKEKCARYEKDLDRLELDSTKQIGELQEQLIEMKKTAAEDIFDPDSIGAKPIIGEREGLYAIDVDDCKIYIDTESHTVQVRKNVRKPAKYSKKFALLNQENLTETYFLTSASVNCRKAYTNDVKEEIQNILNVFSQIK